MGNLILRKNEILSAPKGLMKSQKNMILFL